MFFRLFRLVSVTCLLAACLTHAAPAIAAPHSLAKRQNSTTTGRLVFCHFMIGIVGDRTSAADYDSDMQRAKSLGIDAFALNIGVDPYTDAQLGYAYESAAKNDVKVFISFDFNWYHAESDAAAVGQKIALYGKLPAQLMYDGKVFASSFAGDALDVAAMRAAAGVEVFWAPNFHPGQSDASHLDGALNWMAWDNDGYNKAPKGGSGVTVENGDDAYIKWLGGKPYIAPVSPWFSTHFGPEVPYSKNWVFPGDLLWFRRWNEILKMGPQFLEIVTWNDYGESHYIGPLASTHYDDGNSKWVNDMPHGGWLDMAKPFIAAFHAGASTPDQFITEDELIYWYRPNLRSLDCDATDTTMVPASNGSGNYFQGRPDGWESMADSVFVVSLLTAPATITVTSGGNTKSFEAPAGASAFEVDMGVGQQTFLVERGSSKILSGTSLKDITDVCICGIYNFNAYVGTLPESASDPLDKDGLASLTAGLHVSTCSPVPSLGSSGNGTAPERPTVTRDPGSAPTKGPAPPITRTTVPQTAPGSAAPPAETGPVTTSKAAGPPAPPAPTGEPEPEPQPEPSSVAPGPPKASNPPSAPGFVGESCAAGTVAPGESDNYVGLCTFACQYGYCPPGPCVCTTTGTPKPAPADTGASGCPLVTEHDGYLGLCKFSCARGYCPETACRASC